MNKNDAELLKQRLHDEGRENDPAFSPLLHERIMTTLRVRGQAVPDDEFDERRFPWGIAVPIAAAAAITIVIMLILNTAQPTDGSKRAQTPPQQPPGNTFSGTDSPTRDLVYRPRPLTFAPVTPTEEQTAGSAQFAYLDRDAVRFATFLADQLPSFNVVSTGEKPAP